jgi:hypothetical protein
MSGWTHAICDDCWDKNKPGAPGRLGIIEKSICCWCGRPTWSGIYLCEDPAALPCGGSAGPVHQEA